MMHHFNLNTALAAPSLREPPPPPLHSMATPLKKKEETVRDYNVLLKSQSVNDLLT